LAAAEEAVSLWQALAHGDPDQYQEIYNRNLAKLRRKLSLHWQESASILLHLNDDSLEHDKPHDISPAPNRSEQ
jgi:hypothetical protein